MADDADIRALLQQPLKIGRGRRAVPFRAEYVRDLTLEDLLTAATTEMGSKPPVMSKPLRQSHHMLARVLAGGATLHEASAITGYCYSRISILKNDPAFENLMLYYQGLEAEEHERHTADMHKRLAALGFDTIEVLHERLLERPDSFSAKELVAAIELVTDRTGHGKSSTVKHDHEFALSDTALAAIKASQDRGRPLTEEDRAALLGMAARLPPVTHPETSSDDGIEGEWTVVREEGGEGDPEAAAGSGVVVPLVVPVPRP